eukprot:2285811-Pyramimonas_sp.AAC.1
MHQRRVFMWGSNKNREFGLPADALMTWMLHVSEHRVVWNVESSVSKATSRDKIKQPLIQSAERARRKMLPLSEISRLRLDARARTRSPPSG